MPFSEKFFVRKIPENALCSFLKITAGGRGDFDFCTPSWINAWQVAYLPGKGWKSSLAYYGVFNEDNPVQQCRGMAVFGRQSLMGIGVTSVGGYYWPYRSVYMVDRESEAVQFAQALAGFLSHSGTEKILRFGPVSAEDSALASLFSELRNRGWTHFSKTTGKSFLLGLENTTDALEEKASPSLKKNIKYQRRRLEKISDGISEKRISLCATEGSDMADLATIERASWVHQQGKDVKFSRLEDQVFWSALKNAPDSFAPAIFWIMKSGDTPIAYSAHIETQHRTYIIANGYDERWKQYSPGSVLSQTIFNDAVARGRKSVDWGMGDSGYKQKWGALGLLPVQDHLLFHPGLTGRALGLVAGKVLRDWHRHCSST